MTAVIRKNPSVTYANEAMREKYQELLGAQRAKTWRLFNGWTKAGRCEMVAKEIIDRLARKIDGDQNLLIEVLFTQVFPNIDKKCQEMNRRYLVPDEKGVTPELLNNMDLAKLLNNIDPTKKNALIKILKQSKEKAPDLLEFFKKVPSKEKKETLIDQLDCLFSEKIIIDREIARCIDTFRDIPGNEIVDFISNSR